MEKNPEIQFRSPEDIKSYQEEQLAKVLAYLQAHSKFYQQMFAEHHIDINQIKTIEDLQQIPVTTKTDLQLHNDDFIAVLQCGQPVRDGENSRTAGFLHLFDFLLNVLFGGIIQRRRSFVQDQYFGLL